MFGAGVKSVEKQNLKSVKSCALNAILKKQRHSLERRIHTESITLTVDTVADVLYAKQL
jgi:hypothetical protein